MQSRAMNVVRSAMNHDRKGLSGWFLDSLELWVQTSGSVWGVKSQYPKIKPHKASRHPCLGSSNTYRPTKTTSSYTALTRYNVSHSLWIQFCLAGTLELSDDTWDGDLIVRENFIRFSEKLPKSGYTWKGNATRLASCMGLRLPNRSLGPLPPWFKVSGGNRFSRLHSVSLASRTILLPYPVIPRDLQEKHVVEWCLGVALQ